MFRTNISYAYKDNTITFAGHYIIASWGCGTACQMHALIDTKTGIAKPLLSRATSLGLDYRADSKLLIVNPGAKNHGGATASKTKFYLLEDDSLKAISKQDLHPTCK